MRALLPVLAFSVACNPDKITEKEAEAVYGANNTVVGELSRTLVDAVQDQVSPDGLTITYSDTSAAISGSLDGGANWTGVVDIDGSAIANTSNDEFSADLALGYGAVEAEGVILDGDTTLGAVANYDLAAGQVYFSFDTGGDFAVSGEAKGQAGFGYLLVVDVNISTGVFDFSSQGDIEGFDTSTMGVTDLAAWVLALYAD